MSRRGLWTISSHGPCLDQTCEDLWVQGFRGAALHGRCEGLRVERRGVGALGSPGAERAGDVRNDPRVPHAGDKEEEEPAEQPQRGHSLRLPAHCRGLPPSFPPPPRTDEGIWALRAPKDEASKVDFLAASQPCIRRCLRRLDTHRSPRVGYVRIAFYARIGAEA